MKMIRSEEYRRAFVGYLRIGAPIGLSHKQTYPGERYLLNGED